MAYEFDAFTPTSAAATQLTFAYTNNLGTANTLEVRLIGTGLANYNTTTGAFDPSATITQIVLFDTTTNAAIQTVDIDPLHTADVAAAATVFLAQAVQVKDDIAALATPLPAFDNLSVAYSLDGLSITLTLLNLGIPVGSVVLAGSGFVQDTPFGTVNTLTVFNATDPPVQTGLIDFVAVHGGAEPLGAVAISFGAQDLLYQVLTQFDDTITNNAQTSDSFSVNLDPGLGANTVNGSATFGGFASYANSDQAVTIDLGAQTVTKQTSLAVDQLTNIGGAEGSAFNDTLTGSNNNDFLAGSAGDDTFDGGGVTLDNFGLGFDVMVGGRGSDTFNVAPVGGSALNYIVSYNENGDAPAQGVFVNLDAAVHTFDPLGLNRLVSGATAFDSYGDSDLLVGVHNVVGSNFADYFFGSTQSDVFTVGNGDDNIDGNGSGLDFDILVYSQTRNLNNVFNYSTGINVQFDAAGGGTASSTNIGTDTFKDIELVTGTQFADTFSTVGPDGFVYATGNGGNDTFTGNVTSINDTVNYSFEAAAGGNGFAAPSSPLTGTIGIIANLAAPTLFGVVGGTVRDTFGNTDTLISIENIVGSVFNDFMAGSGTADFLDGNGGGDVIFGGAGDDRIFSGSSGLPGGGGALDILIGDAGADTFDGSNGSNGSAIVDYALEGGANSVIINLDSVDHTFGLLNTTIQAHKALDTHGDTDSLINITSVIGTIGNDIMWGSSADEFFTAGIGDDEIHGGGGTNDQLFYNGVPIVSSAFGPAVEAFNLTTGVTVAFTGDGTSGTVAGNAGGNNAGTDTFDGIEKVVGTKFADIFNGTGGTARNVYMGMNGNDIFNGSADILAHDIVDYSNDFLANGGAGISVNIAANTATDGFGDTDTLNDIEDAIGTTSADTFFGNDKANFFDGRLGGDTMTGGDGNDTYVVQDVNDAVVEGNGVNSGFDTIISEIDILALAANVEMLELGTPATHGVGNGASNIITGNALANTLEGLEGDDYLDGKGGADTLIGGNGDDIYVIDNSNDTADETGTTGTDRINSFISFSLANTAQVLGGDIEILQLLGIAVSGTGNDLNNLITGNTISNTLDGGLGADTMIGLDGSDIYVIDNTGDIADETGATGTDLVRSMVNFSLADAVHAKGSIENLTLLGTAITGTGNTLANTITGNANANTLGGGVDALIDTLIGGAGDDTYVLGASTNDVITEAAGAAGGVDTITSSINRSLATFANVEKLTLLAGAALTATGNTLANTITGNANANTLGGGVDALADTLVGGLGNDIYNIQSANDIITELVGQGTADKVVASVSYVLGAAANIEIMQTVNALAVTALNLTGNNSVQTMTGNNGANSLSGLGGNDIISGLGGGDTINGGLGNDTLTGGLGNDFFVFNTALNALTNKDTITDFNVVNDTIRLENSGVGLFNTLTGAANIGPGGVLTAAAFAKGAGFVSAHDATDRIVYNTTTGDLYYDRDGIGGAAAIKFATLTTHPAITNLDFVII